MTEAMSKLLEILESDTVYWLEETLPNVKRADSHSGDVRYFQKREGGKVTFACDNRFHTIGRKGDTLGTSGQCVVVHGATEEGMRQIRVFASNANRSEAEEIMSGYVRNWRDAN